VNADGLEFGWLNAQMDLRALEDDITAVF